MTRLPSSRIALSLFALVFAMCLGFAGLIAAQDQALRGYPASRATEQRALESRARKAASSGKVASYMHVMAAEPHHAGTEASRRVAEYILQSVRSWGWDAEFEVFEVLLPYPGQRHLELLEPHSFRATLAEPGIEEDNDSNDHNQLPTYNAYAASGDVTAPLVYVNYGTPEDYAELERLGVSVKGKVVIARYGQSWRGIKPKLAQERGALACLIFSDPADDGFSKGGVYPEGPYRPPLGVQRGSVMDMPIYPGDPITPGVPSVPGVRRLKPEEAPTILKIPVLPISHADARPLLEAIGGSLAPQNWQGGMKLKYRIGDGKAKVRVAVEHNFEIRKIYNVIATMKGKDYPEEWVIYGNHHDAWVNGANDPISGTSVVMETARVLGDLKRSGWRPSRTIKLCFWDGEEFGIIGSTEWVEKHAAELQRSLVAYFNSDSNGRGQIRVGGSHQLTTFIREVLDDVPDPATGRNVLEARNRMRRSLDGEDSPFRVEPAGSGSDYAPFLHHITMPSLNLGFGGGCPSSGVYHSIYDSIAWFEKFCDPGHKYGKALSDVMLTAILRLSNAPLLPYEFGELAERIRAYREDVGDLAAEKRVTLDWSRFDDALDALSRESARWNNFMANAVAEPVLPPEALRQINIRLIPAERELALAKGLPERPWYRHQIYAPGLFTGYGVKTLPGIRESLEQGDAALAREHVALAAQAISRLRSTLRAIRQDAESSQERTRERIPSGN